MFMSSSRGGFGKPLAAAFRFEKDVGMQVAIPQVPLPADLPYRLYHRWRARDVGLPTGHVVDVRGNGLMDEAFATRGGFSRRRQHDGMREPGVCVRERIQFLQTVDVARLACPQLEMNGQVS